MKTAAAILFLVLLVAFATNPDEYAHREAVAAQVAKQMGTDPGNFWVDAVGTIATKRLVSVRNYYIFSLTEIQLNNQGTTVGLGVFGQVYILIKIE